jgi:hypothetical protein
MQIKNTLMLDSIKIDSIDRKYIKLSHTVDSLKVLLNNYSVSTSYYHDIINTDVATFILIVSIIVAVIGLISWRSIIFFYKKKTTEIRREYNSLINSQKKEFDAIINEINNKIHVIDSIKNDLDNTTARSFYYITHQRKTFSLAFSYALQAAINFWAKKNINQVVVWLDTASLCLDEEDLDIANLKSQYKKESDKLNILIESSDSILSEKAASILEKLSYKIYDTKK